ncbi:hypothetical protein GE09DRAFT_761485 [Coniochaeta sp. 2T2.1]|nr:hypothetical protein GE09DRAFT_761485 [Coniochaeta sp. 2T2.1]
MPYPLRWIQKLVGAGQRSLVASSPGPEEAPAAGPPSPLPEVYHHRHWPRLASEGKLKFENGEGSILLLVVGSRGAGKSTHRYMMMYDDWTNNSSWDMYDPTGPGYDAMQFICGGYRLYLSYIQALKAYAVSGFYDYFSVMLVYDVQSRDSWEAFLRLHAKLRRGIADGEEPMQSRGRGPQIGCPMGSKKRVLRGSRAICERQRVPLSRMLVAHGRGRQ